MSSSLPHSLGADRLWGESWYFDFATEEGIGGFLRLGTLPGHATAWVWACLVGQGPSGPLSGGRARPVVLVRDHEVPIPRPGALEVRAAGLWVDLVCETPDVHWTLGLEAFGVALDDPSDALAGERGVRTPLGFDLEWEATEPPFEHPVPGSGDEGHVQHRGAVHGEVLVGSDRLQIEGTGQRDHFWGVRDWWGPGWHWAACVIEADAGGDAVSISVARPDRPGPEHATGYLSVAGEDPRPITFAEVDTRWVSGHPSAVEYRLHEGLEPGADAGMNMTAEVVARVALLLPSPDGVRASHLHRGLCRFSSPYGTGMGWAEWLVSP